ncbi:helix-turn-helix domain-containing protein [Saccharopolyspora sp. K220]|uniref:helix-turn-helix domain-containing protein n=1 Tax=Saccharopolyspora soli TaxID=2926618 RepID=UPI001F55AC52|nr:helix-turn-helix domain-containing protein [Saccharopolyspora soli]MCI2415841.1 helix-turn-helix domain-containing protein [Saccharopolyspora soli]
MMTARDARNLSPEALEELRRRAVAAVESGSSRTEVARLLGVSRKTVGAWLRAYRRTGEESFRPKVRGRRPGEQLALSPAQQAWTVKTIAAGTPDEHDLPHALWTRQAVAELVNREYRILLSPATVGQYLARWGLIDEPYLREMMRARVTAVVPRQRAVAAVDEAWIPEAEVLWVAWTLPHAAPERTGATRKKNLLTGFRNYFGDVNVLQAISNRGAVFFQARVGPFDSAHTEGFLVRLMDQFGRPLNVIICRWPAEHHGILRAWPRRHSRRISLRFTLN